MLFGNSRYKIKIPKKGFANLFKSWESFFTRRLYHRLQDCWNRPLSSGPGVYVNVMERISTDNNCTLKTSGKSTRCLNLGSYNYLGFADDWKQTCRDEVQKSVNIWPNSLCSSRYEFGTISVHEELEKAVAKFVGKEAAVVFTMGFATNSTTIPILMGEGSLIISDLLNHTSIVNGARASASPIRVFRHNDPAHLEEILREAIVKGQPRHHRPWKKILVMVEGIYSMVDRITVAAFAVLKISKAQSMIIFTFIISFSLFPPLIVKFFSLIAFVIVFLQLNFLFFVLCIILLVVVVVVVVVCFVVDI